MSAYGAGAPTYEDPELQKAHILGRLKVAAGIRERATDYKTRETWSRTIDELLDKLNEVKTPTQDHQE